MRKDPWRSGQHAHITPAERVVTNRIGIGQSIPTIAWQLGVYHHEHLHAFECMGCLEMIEIPQTVFGQPEAQLRMREMLELDHSECHKYESVRDAQLARKFRKEFKRRKLVRE